MPALEQWTDGEVARAIMAGGTGATGAAEAELYRRFAPRVRLYGLRHLRDEDAARDLAQHVLMLAIGKLRDGAVREPDQIASFILGASRTSVIDLRRQERRRQRLRDTLLAPVACADPLDDGRLDLDRLEACLAALAERERVVVLLSFYAEKTASDAAGELGTTAGNVRVIRHRALQRLRTCILSGESAR